MRRHDEQTYSYDKRHRQRKCNPYRLSGSLFERTKAVNAARWRVAALLSTCASTPGETAPVEALAPKPVAAVADPGPTIAERAARYDQIVQRASPPPGATSAPRGSKDCLDRYPHFAPAPKARANGSLQSFLALDTGPYLVNSVIRNLTWTNDSGRRLAIFKAYLWTGVDKGGIADVHFEVRRASGNSYIGISQWDHYADPTLPQHGLQFKYPSPMMLDPGRLQVVEIGM